jgi:hypothetical protein
METVEKIIRAIQRNLSPELLKPKYRKENASNPMFGHCYVATETLYHLIDGFKEYGDFLPYQNTDSRGISHWWLQRPVYGYGWIIDVTEDQYISVGLIPPYIGGKHRHFLTSYPSKRTVILMRRVRKDLTNKNFGIN